MPRLKISQPNASFSGNVEIEDRLLDQLIWGTNDPEVQKSLIGRDEKLTLNTAIDIARSYEATKRQMVHYQIKIREIPSELITLLARNRTLIIKIIIILYSVEIVAKLTNCHIKGTVQPMVPHVGIVAN